MGCGDVRLLRTIGSVDFTGQERAALNKLTMPASAIGFYGDRGREVLDESAAAGSGFLPEVCQAWEAAVTPARERGMRVAHLRIGIVLSPLGGIVNLASCWQSYRMPSYRGYRFPPEIISHAVWLYHRFALSFPRRGGRAGPPGCRSHL